MATKDISDIQVIKAYLEYKQTRHFPYDILYRDTGQPIKVCYRAMERAEKRGYIDYGTSLRTGWVTEKGYGLLKESEEHHAIRFIR